MTAIMESFKNAAAQLLDRQAPSETRRRCGFIFTFYLGFYGGFLLTLLVAYLHHPHHYFNIEYEGFKNGSILVLLPHNKTNKIVPITASVEANFTFVPISNDTSSNHARYRRLTRYRDLFFNKAYNSTPMLDQKTQKPHNPVSHVVLVVSAIGIVLTAFLAITLIVAFVKACLQ